MWFLVAVWGFGRSIRKFLRVKKMVCSTLKPFQCGCFAAEWAHFEFMGFFLTAESPTFIVGSVQFLILDDTFENKPMCGSRFTSPPPSSGGA